MNRLVSATRVLVVVTMLGGCATSVNGTGSSIAFPSTRHAGTSSAPFTATPSGPPAPSGTIPAGDPTVGSLVTDAAGHMRVRLVGVPQRKVETDTFSGEKLTIYLHGAAHPYKEQAATELYVPALPTASPDSEAHDAIRGFSVSSGFTLGDEEPVTFRGHAARTATFTDATRLNGQYTLLVIVWLQTRVYYFFAPSGKRFNDMMASFEPIG